MTKLLLLICAIIYSSFIFAQIPEGYYDGTEDLQGEDLKTALNEIIKGHTKKSYGDARYILDEADADPDIEGNVLLIYNDMSVSGEWDAGATWNREHVWAKSRGDFGTNLGPGSDLHNLRACHPQVNSDRSNRWFGESDAPYKLGGVETGSYISTTSWFWEPRDEDKGDVARIIFYMSTRYEGNDGELDLEAIDYVPDNNFTNDPVHALLSEFLQWHIDDPVSAFEQNRNEVIFSHQKNRNPFIDHPEFVDLVWNPKVSVAANNLVEAKLYPNPCQGILNIETNETYEKIVIYNVIGLKVKELGFTTKVDLSDVVAGQYLIQMQGQDEVITLPLIVGQN